MRAVAGTYFITLVTERHACDFELTLQVTPFSQILHELDTGNDGQVLLALFLYLYP